MLHYLKRRTLLWIVALLCVSMMGCRNARNTRNYVEPPPRDIKPTVIEYVEQDAFDLLFENALINQDPVILIQTNTARPDWGARLNAWIAAWNRGGLVVAEPRVKARMQAPTITVNGETLREFRLLIDDLMNRVESLARLGTSWWTEERTQNGRIALLKPYNLRFHLNSDGNIQLIFFNGRYARYYERFIEAMGMQETDEPSSWSRDIKCSHCKGLTGGSISQRTSARLEEPE
jgi:hypothetical protein